jgi:hypothetical protein
MLAHGADINDRSCLLPGNKQRILILGYQLPLDVMNGLPYFRCYKPTENELASLPHIVMTSDVEWDPRQYDKDIDNLEEFHDPLEDVHPHDHFDQYGEYCHRTVSTTHHTCLEEEFYDACEFLSFNDEVDDLMDTVHNTRYLRLLQSSSCFTLSLVGLQLIPSSAPSM